MDGLLWEATSGYLHEMEGRGGGAYVHGRIKKGEKEKAAESRWKNGARQGYRREGFDSGTLEAL